MLDIDFVCLIARERQIEPVQLSFPLVIEQFFAVQEIRRLMLFAKEKPVSSRCPVQQPLLDERAEGSDAGSWPAHNSVLGAIFGQAKGSRFLNINWNILDEQLSIIGEKAGSEASF